MSNIAVEQQNEEEYSNSERGTVIPVPKEFIAEYPSEDDKPLFRYPDPVLFTPLPTRKFILSWKVLGIRTITNSKYSNAIADVTWEAIGRDNEGNEGVYTSTTTLDLYGVSSDDMIPYEQLTEETIVSWIKEKLNERYIDHIQEQIQKDIYNKKSLVLEFTGSSLPWKKT